MEKYKVRIILTLFSIILGVFIATQMKSNVEYYAPVTIKSIENLSSEITAIKTEIDDNDRIIKEKEEELDVLDNVARGDEDIIDILSGDLKYSKSISGHTRLEGPGLSIKMYDNPDSQIVGADVNDDVIHDLDILNILNDLKIAGAEAISINDQRVLSSSEIMCRGPVIRINGKSIATPFVIKAIGDPKLLMASVVAPDTNGDVLKNVYHIGFEPKTEDKITIPEYTGRFSFKYAKPMGEGDN